MDIYEVLKQIRDNAEKINKHVRLIEDELKNNSVDITEMTSSLNKKTMSYMICIFHYNKILELVRETRPLAISIADFNTLSQITIIESGATDMVEKLKVIVQHTKDAAQMASLMGI